MIDTQKTNNENPFSAKRIISSSILGGLTAAGIERAFLPVEVKAAIKNTRFGQDTFIKKTKKFTEKTIQKIEQSRNPNALFKTEKITIDKVVENAKNLYPEFVETTKAANKTFAKTFIGVASAIAGAKILSSLILKSRETKE